MGTAAVQGIYLNMAGLRTLILFPQAFTEMHNLRFLMFYHCHQQFADYFCNVCIPLGLESLPNALGYLSWLRYPLISLPSDFSAENLVELHMRRSKLQRLRLNGRYLKRIDLSDSTDLVEVSGFTESLESITLQRCRSLVQVPDLSKSVNIETIDFTSCIWLPAIPSYFKFFTKLTSLNLRYCRNLKVLPEMPSNIEFLNLELTGIEELPSSIWSLKKLVELNLTMCRDIKNILPNSTWKLNFVQSLDLAHTSIEGFPSSMGQCLSRVVSIDLRECSNFVSLPTSICKLKYLKTLHLDGCYNFNKFPEILEPMQHLEFLSLSNTKIEKLPLSITNLVGLKILQLSKCKSLRSLTNLPRLLEKLDTRGCWSLKTVDSTAFTHGVDQIFDQGFEYRNEEHIFSSCLNLNQTSRRNIMDDARRRIMRMATALAKPEVQEFYEKSHGPPFSVTVICPGNKIPEWFSCGTEGCRSINIKLPLHWYDENFLGFAVSAVVSKYHGHEMDSELLCESRFRTTDGEGCDFCSRVEQASWDLQYACDNADHVLMWYQPSKCTNGVSCSTDLANATEASFHFTVTVYSVPLDTNIIIQRCGVCFLYSQANDMNFEVIDIDEDDSSIYTDEDDSSIDIDEDVKSGVVHEDVGEPNQNVHATATLYR
ncbi:hypothetical protein M0R45_005945 [Rubus argutus]|uniref:C-JID domain-containing protein n=1 Tax=Rubus argutus TaxID=59490 RepID=A0AAW1YPE9_RUBAR